MLKETKYFECQPSCQAEDQYIDKIIISCDKCIKHIEIKIAPEIAKALLKYYKDLIK
jgi:hypothetical protein